jgi:hypothetical protein
MFEKLVSFTKKVADLPDRPSTNPKAQFDLAPDEVRQYLNKLIDALKSTETDDSGAKNIGVSSISGLTGSDVQTLLGSLKDYSVSMNPDAWTTATFTNGNGWSNYDAIRTLRYRKIGNYAVQIIGTIKNTPGSTPTTTIFTLPAGYRPVFQINWIIDASPSTGGGPTEMTCDVNGNVNVSAWRGSTADYVHINCIIPIG